MANDQVAAASVSLPVETAREMTHCALAGAGLGPADAATVADHLVDATRRGYPSYGLQRVPELTSAVRRTPASPVTVTRRNGPVAQLDGGGTIGYVVGRSAMSLALELASEFGVGVVGANNTYFTGLLGYYCEMAAERGLASIVASSNEALVAPAGGREARLGTNPIAIGFPNGDEPIIWDIGTSAITRGEVWLHARRDEPLPAGVAIDPAGQPTTDATAALAGAILPWGGHRGSGLSVMIQLLGLLAGAPDVGSREVGGHSAMLLIAVDPGRLSGPDDLAGRTARFTEYLRSTAGTGEDVVRLPFERSRLQRESSVAAGLTVDAALHAELLKLARMGGFGGAAQPDRSAD